MKHDDSIYPVQLQLRIDWSEMDLFGHVNNVMFFKYIQASRVHYWETIRMTEYFTAQGIGPILASTQCHFRKPLFYPGMVTIKASVTFIKNSSFGIAHRLLNDQQELVAEAEDVIVTYDFKKQEKVPFPDDMRAVVAALEQRAF